MHLSPLYDNRTRIYVRNMLECTNLEELTCYMDQIQEYPKGLLRSDKKKVQRKAQSFIKTHEDSRVVAYAIQEFGSCLPTKLNALWAKNVPAELRGKHRHMILIAAVPHSCLHRRLQVLLDYAVRREYMVSIAISMMVEYYHNTIPFFPSREARHWLWRTTNLDAIKYMRHFFIKDFAVTCCGVTQEDNNDLTTLKDFYLRGYQPLLYLIQSQKVPLDLVKLVAKTLA